MSSSPKTQNLNPNPWTIVSNRRNRKNQKPIPNPSTNSLHIESPTLKSPIDPIPWSPSNSQFDPLVQSKLQFKLKSTINKLRSSQFYTHFVELLDSPQIQTGINKLLEFSSTFQFIIYGIGSIDSYESPRLQLGLALLIYEHFKSQISSVEVFDPVISANECTVIEGLGFKVMRVDENGRREVQVPTLFFMPHCEVQLYDNLLSANWGAEHFNKMVVLGNSFGEYETYANMSKSLGGSVSVEEAGKRVIKSRQFFREVEVGGVSDGDDGFFRAFHDISWHFFNIDNNVDLDGF